jgi:hypothetical protein
MRKLVDDRELRFPCENRVEVHLLRDCTAIANFAKRNNFQPVNQRGSLCAPMRFDEANHHIMAFGAKLPCLCKHSISLAHSSGGAHVHFERPLLGCRQKVEEFFGCPSFLVRHRRVVAPHSLLSRSIERG